MPRYIAGTLATVLTALQVAMVCMAAGPRDLQAQQPLRLDFRVDATITYPVLTMALGPDGRVWLGTESELLRYDGYNVDHFSHDPSDSMSLPFGVVRTLLCDSRGRLWVGMSSGLVQFDPLGLEVVRVFRHDPADPSSLSADDVSALYEDREGRIWVGTLDWSLPDAGGLNRFDEATEGFERFTHDPADASSLSHDRIRSILQDSHGDLWVGTWHGLNRLRAGADDFERYLHDDADPWSLAYDDVTVLHEDAAGDLWVATIGGGLDRFDRERRRFVHLPTDSAGQARPASAFITVLEEDARGRLWIGTLDAGLWVLERASGEVRRVDLGPDVATDSWVYRLLRTPDDVLWASVADPLGSAGTLLRLDLETPSLGGRDFGSVQGFYEDTAGTLWMGTIDGELLRWDRDRDSVREFVCPGLGAPSTEQWLSSVVQSPDGTLWLGFWDGDVGLCRLDPGADAPRVVRLIPTGRDGPRTGRGPPDIRWVEDLAWWNGRLWLAYNAGLASFDPSTGEVRDLDVLSTEAGSFDIGRVVQVEPDSAGHLWAATPSRGILRLSPEADRAVLFDPLPPAGPRDVSGTVTSIQLGPGGRLWIGTLGRGACGLDPVNGECGRVLEMAEGLPEASVMAALEDVRGHLWISTPYAITEIDPESGAVRSPPLPRRLKGMRFRASALAAPSGNFFFAGSRGVVAFRPEQTTGNTSPPKILITDVEALGSAAAASLASLASASGSDSERANARRLRLSHRQNDLVFEYAALHYADPLSNRYRVRLEGYEADWRDVGSQRRARYTNLAPGPYRFRVRAANANGVWSDQDATFAFRILAPWWRRPWAIALWFLLVFGGLAAMRWAEIRKVRTRAAIARERAEALRVRELAEARSHLFANLSHEYRTPLALILGQIESARAERAGVGEEKLEMAARQARELERLTDELLELSRLEAGALELDARVEDLAALARDCAAAFDSAASQRNIRLILDLPGGPVLAWIDRDRMARVVNNLLSNALKFTDEGGAVSVRVRQIREPGESGATLTVEDTGIGIPASALPEVFDRFYQVDAAPTRRAGGTGIGLALVRELVQLHGGTVEVRSEVGVGTRFEVRLPPPPEGAATPVPGHGKPALRPSEAAHVADNIPADTSDLATRHEEPAPVSGETPEASAAPAGPPIILIVEDHSDMRAFLRQELSAEHRVEEAQDGAAGLARAVELIPDLVITDVMMPEMNGYELVRRLRADERTSHVPIIMLTGRTSEDAQIEGLETGVDDYLAKPFSARVLRTRVRNLLNLRRLLRARYADEIWLRPQEIDATSIDRQFLERLTGVIESHMAESAFSVEELASAVAMSRSQLHRKLTALLNQSPGALIRGMRLRRAADLLRSGSRTISQIAYQTGFSDQAHFTRSFKQRFGCTPSEYRDRPPDGHSP